MKRPLAYITAPWSENEFENTENAAKYCRAVYDAGFSPVCPTLFLPLFLRDEIPQEHKDCIDMAREYLRRARVLVVCGGTVNESVKNDIAVAERLRITATTLDGILPTRLRPLMKSRPTQIYASYCRVDGQGFGFVLPDEADKLRGFFAEHQDKPALENPSSAS